MFERFTDQARKALALAKEEARGIGHDYLGTEHILLGVLSFRCAASIALESALKDVNRTAVELRGTVRALVPPASEGEFPDQLRFTADAKAVLSNAVAEAEDLGHNYVCTEHILLGMVGAWRGIASTALSKVGLQPEAIRWQVLHLFGIEPDEKQEAAPTKGKGSGSGTFDRFSENARKALNLARGEAREFRSESIGTEHLLLGILVLGKGIAVHVLEKGSIDLASLQRRVRELTRFRREGTPSEKTPFAPSAKESLELALEEAASFKHNYIGTEHILLGLLREGEGIAAATLSEQGLELEKLREATLAVLGPDSAVECARDSNQRIESYLTAFGFDLTEEAKGGALGTYVDRPVLMQRLDEVLLRHSNPNAVLVGKPGSGKTCLARGLATRIVNGMAAKPLRERQLIELDLARMARDTEYRGEFEIRLGTALREAHAFGSAILFIDDLSLLRRGHPTTSTGSMPPADILKPALSEGGISVIGTATQDQWELLLRKDGALARRFQLVEVPTTSLLETHMILEGLQEGLEAHHRVRYSGSALQAAVRASGSQLDPLVLPGSAIRALGLAANLARRDAELARPPEFEELPTRIEQLEAEKEKWVSAQEFDKASLARDQSDKLKKKLEAIRRKWEADQKGPGPVVEASHVERAVAEDAGSGP